MWQFIMTIATSILPWFSPAERMKAKRVKLAKLKAEKTRLTTRTRPSEKRVKELLKLEKEIAAIELDLMS